MERIWGHALLRWLLSCDTDSSEPSLLVIWAMDSGALDSPVTLVIKAPNQKYEDQTINCFLNWTVERLKSHISNVYPSKPVSSSQVRWVSCFGKFVALTGFCPGLNTFNGPGRIPKVLWWCLDGQAAEVKSSLLTLKTVETLVDVWG